jgi:hypothetical protein
MILRPPPPARNPGHQRLQHAFAAAHQPLPRLLDPGKPLDPCHGLDYIRGLLRFLPATLIHEVLAQTGRLSQRKRRLPADAVVWLVIAQALFRDRSIPKVWRQLHPSRDEDEPVPSAFGQARQRLGERPLRQLYRHNGRCLGQPDDPGVFFKGLRKVALDGSVVEMPDTPANRAAFGSASNQHGPGAFPQLRLAALCELGTHALVDVQLGRYDRAETKLCGALLNRMPRGCLLLLDRGLSYYWLVRAAVLRGNEVLARVKAQQRDLPIEEVLADGSYRSTIYPSATARRRRVDGIAVRVIRYTHHDPALASCGEVTCLLTTILDRGRMSAEEAVATYPWRWEEELALKEVKVVLLRNQQPLLRSKTPALVVQEVYGLLLAQQMVRQLMAEAARGAAVAPARLSYKHSLEVLEDRLRERVGRKWYAGLLREVSQQQLPDKRERPSPRVKKANRKRWPTKKVGAAAPAKPTLPFAQAVEILPPGAAGSAAPKTTPKTRAGASP